MDARGKGGALGLEVSPHLRDLARVGVALGGQEFVELLISRSFLIDFGALGGRVGRFSSAGSPLHFGNSVFHRRHAIGW